MASSLIVPGSLFLALRAVRVLLTSSGTVPRHCYPDASAPIHPSAWKGHSPTSASRIPYNLGSELGKERLQEPATIGPCTTHGRVHRGLPHRTPRVQGGRHPWFVS